MCPRCGCHHQPSPSLSPNTNPNPHPTVSKAAAIVEATNELERLRGLKELKAKGGGAKGVGAKGGGVIDLEDATRLVYEALDMWDTTQTEVPSAELQAGHRTLTSYLNLHTHTYTVLNSAVLLLRCGAGYRLSTYLLIAYLPTCLLSRYELLTMSYSV